MKPYWNNGMSVLYRADARDLPLADGSVHSVVTSPPYFSQRDYQVPGMIGIEHTVQD